MTKYMELLKIDGERPSIELRDNPGVDWVGRTDRHVRRPGTTTMELQKNLFENDDRFLERVLAHEMVHHRNYLAGTEDEKHGAPFRDGAARINAIMGTDFVVEKIAVPRAEGSSVPATNEEPSTKLILALGALGVGGLALMFLARRNRPPVAQRARENERGSYGK